MSIRLALLAAACLGAAGCTPSGPGGTFASLRADDPPPRTCRNVAADAVALSARASAAAGLPFREARVGADGVVDVAWPVPLSMALPAPGAPEVDTGLSNRMARLRLEADTSGCPIAFDETLPPPSASAVLVPAPVQEPVVVTNAPRSAWNAPVAPAAPGARPAAPPPVARQASVGAPVPADQGGVSETNPATRPAVVAPPQAPTKAARTAFRPVDKAAARTPVQTEGTPPVARQAPRPAVVETPPRSAVRAIPIVPQAAPDPAQ